MDRPLHREEKRILQRKILADRSVAVAAEEVSVLRQKFVDLSQLSCLGELDLWAMNEFLRRANVYQQRNTLRRCVEALETAIAMTHHLVILIDRRNRVHSILREDTDLNSAYFDTRNLPQGGFFILHVLAMTLRK